MGWLKKAAKWVAKKAKALVRVVVRVVMTAVGLGLGIVDIFFGWAAWPPKKLRLHIVVLSNQTGLLVTEERLRPAIEFAETRLKSRFGVKLLPYGPKMVQLLDVPAPNAALNVGCNAGAFADEFGDAGDFFAQHVAGWNAIPISMTFPITVFIVESVVNKQGCSLGPLTDYVTVTPDGVDNASLMTHEILHACNLLGHPVPKRNLQYGGNDRGDEVNWLQKNIFRSSRHVTYW